MKIIRQLLKKKRKSIRKTRQISWPAIFWGIMLIVGILYLQFVHYQLITGGPAQPPYSSNADITIKVIPYWYGPPLNFTVTVIDDTHTLLRWENPPDSLGTIIRVGFGDYPKSVTDGYPVYSGNSTEYVDTGNNLNFTGEAYYSAFSDFGTSYSVDYATGLAQGEGMLEIASNIETYAILLGEWLFVLILFALALWRYDPILYMITAIGVGYLGFTWYSTYPIIGLVVILIGAFCIYKTIRYYTG